MNTNLPTEGANVSQEPTTSERVDAVLNGTTRLSETNASDSEVSVIGRKKVIINLAKDEISKYFPDREIPENKLADLVDEAISFYSTHYNNSPVNSDENIVEKVAISILNTMPEAKHFKNPEIGDIVKADISNEEIANGQVAGLDPRIKLEGVGLVNLREVYDEWELTEFAKPDDTTWGARIIKVPDEN